MIRLGLATALLSTCATGGGVGSDELTTPSAAMPVVESSAGPLDPPRMLTNPGSGVFMVWNGAAARAAVAGRNIIVLEPDLRHLSAADWRDGEARWRVEQPSTEGVQLYSLGDRVLLHDRDRAIVVEAARGRVLGRHEAPRTGRGPHSHGVDRVREACAWVGPCGIQAFDCSDGRPLGQYLTAPESRLAGTSDDPSEPDSTCDTTPGLLGRHDEVIVMRADLSIVDDGAKPGPSLVAIDAITGQRRWDRALPSPESRAGITDDGGCWMLDEQPPRVTVVECDDGRARWTREIGPGTLEAQTVDNTLVVGRHHGGRWRLIAYATDDGRPAWGTRLARRQHPVLPKSLVPHAQVTGTRRVYGLVDPPQDSVIGEVVAGRDERLWIDPGGGFVLIGRDLREIDAEGRLTRQRPFTGVGAHTVTTGHVLTHDGDTIEIYDREQLRERARLEGMLSIEATDALPDDRLLLRRNGDDGVALILGLEAPSRGTRR